MSDSSAKALAPTKEKAFFGTSVPVADEPEPEPPQPQDFVIEADDSGIEIEVLDDRSPEDFDKAPLKTEDELDDDVEYFQSDPTEEELRGYADQKVSKRIRRLIAQRHDERRRREAAESLAREATAFAKSQHEERNRLSKLVQQSQTVLVEQTKQRAQAALQLAERQYREAHETGDVDAITKSQQEMTKAQMALAQAPAIANRIIADWQRKGTAEREQQAQQQPPIPEVPRPSERALEWEKKNPWFGQDRVMTSTAYGIHEEVISSGGVEPDSDEYYRAIDTQMRKMFPDKFGQSVDAEQRPSTQEPASAPRRGSPVVATASRGNGSAPRKIQMTATQVTLAKRLGLTPQQYAEQLLKESRL